MSKKEYLYGLNPAFEAIRARKRNISHVFLSTSSRNNPRIKKLVSLLEKANIDHSWEEKGRLISLANTREHQGVVVETVEYPYFPFVDQLSKKLLLLLDNVEDPHNVGAILRTTEIFGFEGVLMANKGVPEIYPSVVKASAGATEFLDITREYSANNYVRVAHNEGYVVVALDGKGTTKLSDLPVESIDKLLLVIGGEDKSVGQYILNKADYIVGLEQKGRIGSLNASVAAAVAMYSISNKKTKK